MPPKKAPSKMLNYPKCNPALTRTDFLSGVHLRELVCKWAT